MELDAFLFMHLSDERTESGTEDPLQEHRLPADHVHLEAPHGQRCRHLQADERRADHDGAGLRLGDDRAAVIECSEQVGSLCAWDIKPDRCRPGGQQDRAVGLGASGQDQLPAFKPKHGFPAQGDAVFLENSGGLSGIQSSGAFPAR